MPDAGETSNVHTGADDLLRQARKVVVLVIGGTLLLFGVALLVLPGPGTVVILLALGLLATEFVWARRWLRRARIKIREAREAIGARFGSDESPKA